MLPKFEFGHFYKFAVSVGLILLAFGFGLPWLVLRDTAGLTIHADDLSQLTPTAQKVVEKKQADQLWIVEHYPAVAVLSAILGSVILSYGSIKWWQRQRVLDETEDVQRDTAKVQLIQMTPQQVQEKQEAEALQVAAEVVEEAIAPAAGPTPTIGHAPDPGSTFLSVYRQEVARIEHRLTAVFTNAFFNTHEIRINMSLEPSAHLTVDLILQSGDSALPSYAVDFKYVTSIKSLTYRIYDGATQVLLFASEATKRFGTTFIAVLVIVYGGPESDMSEARLESLRSRLAQFRRMAGPPLQVVLLSESALEVLSPADILLALRLESPVSTPGVHSL